MESSRQSDENIDDDSDNKDDTKRKSRNLSEKKRRDQFNMLLNQLGSMINTNTRKMDKSSILQSTIVYIKNHSALANESKVHEIQDDWKPSFLSNEEFSYLILEAVEGFIIVLSSNGEINYASESAGSLLGYPPGDLENLTIYEITYQDDQSSLYNILLNPTNGYNQNMENNNDQVSFKCHIKRGNLDPNEETIYECVNFVGFFRQDNDVNKNSSTNDNKMLFIGTGRIDKPQLIRDMTIFDCKKLEFISRHSMDWKFLFLDQRATPIIGYSLLEVLGTLGYDYYHIDDIDKIANCHKLLLEKGECISPYYRFLTKGQQWIWLKTRFFIVYNQWNSKPEFINSTHCVINYSDIIKQKLDNTKSQNLPNETNNNSNNILCKKINNNTQDNKNKTKIIYHNNNNDSDTSFSSQQSQQSLSTNQSSKVSSLTSKKIYNSPSEIAVHHRNQQNDNASCYSLCNDEIQLHDTNKSFITPSVLTKKKLNIQNSMIINQQNIVMTNTQSNIQNELQKKHEELQQLIVNQQEELRRVSEQLSIVKYGIVSPLINVNVNYNNNLCQMRNCNDDNANNSETIIQDISDIGKLNTSTTTTSSMSLVPVETFNQINSTAIISSTGIDSNHQINSDVLFSSGGEPTFLQQQQQAMIGHEQHQLLHGQQQTGDIHQQSSHMMSFEIYQEPIMLYDHSVDSSINQQ
ncbi:hypothetical protein HCN44_001867 [Aphidius gifuensis]|uniref:Circadian locomoter output cycles protein kaput-like n=2 Tax=Aphidius gifuensis TaxID=684658 RepID=A0A834Y1M6_APHGI|nr:hypothetical protein HCN44_001867 [Aphidius gifuensis]